MFKKFLYSLTLIIFTINFTACSIFYPQEQIQASKIINGKFSFQNQQNNASGLFIWEQYNQGWILTLQTPISSDIAKITYGNVPEFTSFTPIYTWENLPLIKQGINLKAEDFTAIMYNISKPEQLKNLLQNQNWQIVKHQINNDNILLEIAKADTFVKLFIIN